MDFLMSRILILDDSAADTTYSSIVLREHFEVQAFSDFVLLKQYLDQLEPGPDCPEVLLCDQNLGAITGDFALRMLRQRLESLDIAFVLYSGIDVRSVARAALSDGAAALLMKPLDEDISVPQLLRIARGVEATRKLKADLRWQQMKNTEAEHSRNFDGRNSVRMGASNMPLTGLHSNALLPSSSDQYKARLDLAMHGGTSSQRWAMVAFQVSRHRALQANLGVEAANLVLDHVEAIARRNAPLPEHFRRQEPNLFLFAFPVDSQNLDAASQQLRSVCMQVIQRFNEPISANALEVVISPAMGFTIGLLGARATELIRQACHALHEARGQAQAPRLCAYSRQAEEAQRAEASMEVLLRRAVQAQQLRTYYQPQIDLSSGRVIGAEALSRWFLDDGREVSPDLFIPLAEKTGLITQLSANSQAQVAHDIGRWLPDLGADFRVAVNISALEFSSEIFEEQVLQRYQAAGVDAERIELEITESAMLANIEVLSRTLQRLNVKGFTVALDDFGTGYSSLSVLHRLCLHRVKIDRAFVLALSDASAPAPIIESVVRWGKDYRFSVLAEGIESAAQLSRAVALGVSAGQGFFFGRAATGDQFLERYIRPGAVRLDAPSLI